MSANTITTNLTDKIKQNLGDTQRIVNTEADLSDLTSGGVITLVTGVYEFANQQMFFSNRFEAEADAEIVITGAGFNQLISLNGGTLFTIDNCTNFILIGLTVVLAIPGAQFWDVTNGGFVGADTAIMVSVGASQTFGTFDSVDTVRLDAFQSLGFTTGVTFSNCPNVFARDFTWTTSLSGSGTAMRFDKRTDATIREGAFNLGVSEFAVFVSPDRFNVPMLLIEVGRRNEQGTLLNTSGTTGTFTAVADDAVASVSITSVTNASGKASFNFTVGPTLFPNQEVDLTGFVTNTAYNVTGGFITATGAGFFQLDGVDFGSDEASGSFSGDRITLTDTTTTLNDDDEVTLITTGSNDYDGGFTVFNQLTNSFQVSAAFTATAAGTWSTEGLDQKAKLFDVSNTREENSLNIGSMVSTGNSTATVISTIDTYVDLDLGTLALAGSNIELWKLINTTTGELLFAGTSNFAGFLIASLSAFSAGATQEFQFRVVKNGSVLDDVVVSAINLTSSLGPVPINVPITATPGDTFRIQVQNVDGTSNIVIQELSMEIQ